MVLGLLLCFLLGGAAIYRYLNQKGDKPFLRASAADLTGTWKNQTTIVKIEARGDNLLLDGSEYQRDGKSTRWHEKSPRTQIPRVLDWDGQTLTYTTVDDNTQRSSQVLTKAP